MAIFRGVGGSLDGQTETISLPVAISQGGTGKTDANAGFNALAPDQSNQGGKYLKTNGANTSWDNLDISTSDISGILPVVNGGTGASTDAGARVNLNAAKLGANTDLTAITGLTGGLGTVDYIDMDTAATPTGAVARFKWNDADGVPEVGLKGGNVTLQIGSEQVQRVTNDSGSTITDGQVVYVTGSTGNKVTVDLAQATSDALSATIIGVVTESIGHNQQGFITTEGLVRDIDTSAFAEGAILWLSPTTPGGITTTKPTAPNHLVMVGYCVRSHATVGSIFVKVQNGYEIGELHDVYINGIANNDVLVYDSIDGRWENKTQSTLAVGSATNVTGTVAIANGGTGATTAANARIGLLPSYTSNANKVLTLNAGATDVEWKTISGTGTVTSVDMTVPDGFAISGNPVTTAGTLAVSFDTGYSLPLTANQTNWDTAYGWGNHAAAGYLLATTAGTTYVSLTGSYADPAWITSIAGSKVSGDISGNAATVTNGVYTTGSYTDPSWINSLTGSKISGNISGNAANVTGTVAIGNGGTGATTAANALTALGAYPAANPSGYTSNTGTVTSVTAGTGLTGGTITSSGTVALAASGVTANTYGSSTAIPVITFDTYGRATGVTTATVAGGQYFGSAATKAIAYNANTIGENVTVTAGNNGLSAGPITISTGFTVTVETGAAWVIV